MLFTLAQENDYMSYASLFGGWLFIFVMLLLIIISSKKKQ